MSKPTHIAYVVTPVKDSEKKIWRPVGAVWPHKNGNGFDIVIPQDMALSGRIVCMPPKAEDARD
jgi:hypothetical protein